MKRMLIVCLASLALAPAALRAEEESAVVESAVAWNKDSLEDLFNARLAEDGEHFAKAARGVLACCDPAAPENLRRLAEYTLYLVANDYDLPQDVRARLTPEVLASYGDSEHFNWIKSRAQGRVDKQTGRRVSNAFATYLLSLEAHARAEAAQSELARLDATNSARRAELATKIDKAEKDRTARLLAAEKLSNLQSMNELGVYQVEVARRKLAEANEELRLALERGASTEAVSAAEANRKRAQGWLASSRKTALKRFQRAADKGDVNGKCNLGMCLLYGYGTPRAEPRHEEAFKLICEAAGEGHPQALNLLGECYRDGLGCSVDLEGAAANFKKSADRGNVVGQYNYGCALLKGQGIERNRQEAVVYLRRAACRLHPEAMDAYATCLMEMTEEEPSGRMSDEEKKRRAEERAKREHEAVAWWYHCATEHQYAPAMVHLGQCFLDGTGVEKRELAGVYWLYRAAMDYDDLDAMNRLAVCCEQGLGGLEASHADANWWKVKAKAKEGDRHARIWLATHDPHRFDRLRVKSAQSARP